MKQMQQTKTKHFHFVGIGGCGMSGLADVLFSQGYSVSGSDVKENKVTEYLKNKGVVVHIGHNAQNVVGADVVVLTSAITKDNPELIAAKSSNIPTIARGELLAQIMSEKKSIAIAGTHGKTTTTSLMTNVLLEANVDPTFFIGGTLHASGTNAQYGQGEYCVAEADESDASFLYMNPQMAVVTNIDADHLGTYDNDFEKLKQSFIKFLNQIPANGLAVVCFDNAVNQEVITKVNSPIATYGFSDGADVQITQFKQVEAQSSFQLNFVKEDLKMDVILNMPGKHNALNATAAIILAKHLHIDDIFIKTAMMNFSGVGRRFQMRGEYQFDGKQALVIDDYGHHPNEIAATIAAVRAAWPERRLVLAFQPHRYTRTQQLFSAFAEVLAKPDQLILLDIYSASEEPIPGVDIQSLEKAINENGFNNIIALPREQSLEALLPRVLKNNDVLVMQGAGDIGAMAAQLVP